MEFERSDKDKRRQLELAYVCGVSAPDPFSWTLDDEIADTRVGRPHFVLLGAGASYAALPNGDKNGRHLPLMREIAVELDLFRLFPKDLQEVAQEDFEAAFSRFADRDPTAAAPIEDEIRNYFDQVRLPDTPTIYDALLLSLREKDVICTFNWDPLLLHARARLNEAGQEFGLELNQRLPSFLYLHGNVGGAYCERDDVLGWPRGRCSKCGEPFKPMKLLFPVEHKDYTSDIALKRTWEDAQSFLKSAFMVTVFGYSAPVTDVEAIDLLKKGWGTPGQRNMEQFEIIDRPGADPQDLVNRWDPFIHSHHYDVRDSFWDSWLAHHPRRTGEAFVSQYIDSKFISDNPIPTDFKTISELIDWFRPLLDAE